jgi:hypothetical protein
MSEKETIKKVAKVKTETKLEKLDPKKFYVIVGLKGAPSLIEGFEYSVDGALAEILIAQKRAKLK